MSSKGGVHLLADIAHVIIAYLSITDFLRGNAERFPIYAIILLIIELIALYGGSLKKLSIMWPLLCCVAVVCYTRILNIYTISFGYVAGLLIEYAVSFVLVIAGSLIYLVIDLFSCIMKKR